MAGQSIEFIEVVQATDFIFGHSTIECIDIHSEPIPPSWLGLFPAARPGMAGVVGCCVSATKPSGTSNYSTNVYVYLLYVFLCILYYSCSALNSRGSGMRNSGGCWFETRVSIC